MKEGDAQAFLDQGVAEGCKLIRPIADQFKGERSGRIEKPYRYMWIVSMRIKNDSPEEMQRQFG